MKFLTKSTSLLFIISSVFAQNSIPLRKCKDIENYLGENYKTIVNTCTDNANGNVEELVFNDNCLSDENIDNILSSSIKTLGYNRKIGCPVNKRALDFFAELPNIEEIEVYGVYEPIDFKVDAVPRKLKIMELRGIALTANNLKEVAKVKTLEEIILSSVESEGVQIDSLKDLPNLKKLTIPEYGVDATSLSKLKNIKHLEYYGKTEDAAIKAISEMSSLEFIYIVDSFVDNLNLEPLKKLNKLNELFLLCPAGKRVHKHFSIKENSLSVLENVNKLTISGFNLSQKNIDEISKLNKLSELIFSSCDYNQNSIVYDSLSNLKNLISITFYGHYGLSDPLVNIPDFVYSLSQLKSLTFNYNEMTTIPEKLLNLKGLEHLDLSHNNIAEIPEFLNNLSSLQYIDLSNNANLKGKTLTNKNLIICKYGKNVCKTKEMSCLSEELESCSIEVNKTTVKKTRTKKTTKKISTKKTKKTTIKKTTRGNIRGY